MPWPRASARAQSSPSCLGESTGCSHGRGGSMHLFAPEVGLMGTSGIVGPSILMATGAAYAFKMLQTDRVSVAFFGDGAVNNGAFHEGLNMAAIWDLPVVFVCENNLYATEVPFATVARNPDVAERACRLWHARRGCRWQRRAGRLPGGAGGRAPGARRRGPDAARMQDLSHAQPRRRHARRGLPHGRRSRGMEGAQPRSSASRST